MSKQLKEDEKVSRLGELYIAIPTLLKERQEVYLKAKKLYHAINELPVSISQTNNHQDKSFFEVAANGKLSIGDTQSILPGLHKNILTLKDFEETILLLNSKTNELISLIKELTDLGMSLNILSNFRLYDE